MRTTNPAALFFWDSAIKKPRHSFPLSFLHHVPFYMAIIASLFFFSTATGSQDAIRAAGSAHKGNAELPISQEFLQLVDHFNTQNQVKFHQRFWQQKYWWNPSPKSHAPVILLQVTSLASDSYTPSMMTNSTFASWAQSLEAMLVTIESRYTGKSFPSNLTTVNLQYDSVNQQVEDLVMFINNKISDWNLPENTRWFLIGSLFDGAYVTWFRSKFPNMSFGSIAVAPFLVATLENREYATTYERYIGSQCTAAIGDTYATISEAFASYTPEQIHDYMVSCGCAFNFTEGDASFFFATSVALNGQFGWNTDFVCSNMSAATKFDKAGKMANFAAVMNAIWDQGIPCESWDISFDTNQQEFRSIFYLQCAEMGQFQTGAVNSIIPPEVNLEWFLGVCAHLFSNSLPPSPDVVNFNAQHGGSVPRGCNMLFVTGPNDPYTSIGPDAKALKALSSSNIVVSSSCDTPLSSLSLLNNPTPMDKCLDSTRATILATLRKWAAQPKACQGNGGSGDGDDNKDTLAIVGTVVGIGGIVIGVLIGVVAMYFVSRYIFYKVKRTGWEQL